MKTWVRRSLNVGALTAGAIIASGAAAHASPDLVSTDNPGVLSGTQVKLPVQLPVNACGNAIAVAGEAAAQCVGGATALLPEWTNSHFLSGGGAGPLLSTDNHGVLTGLQALLPVQAPVDACGNAVGAVLGGAQARCVGGALALPGRAGLATPLGGDLRPEHGEHHDHKRPDYRKPDHKKPHGKHHDHKQPDHQKPHGGKHHKRSDHDEKPDHRRPFGTGGPERGLLPGPSWGEPSLVSAGNSGILSGTQLFAPLQVPIDICGNAVAVLGAAQAQCLGGATAIG